MSFRDQDKYIIENGHPVLDNDFIECFNQLTSFAKNESIRGLIYNDSKNVEYEYINTLNIRSRPSEMSPEIYYKITKMLE